MSDKVQIVMTKEQQRNLLVLLDSVQIKGIQSANEYLHIVSVVQNAVDFKPEPKELIRHPNAEQLAIQKG